MMMVDDGDDGNIATHASFSLGCEFILIIFIIEITMWQPLI